ncbi:MAG: cyclic-phosphate processing receiver domain-containing protein [Bacteroidota bacterium]
MKTYYLLLDDVRNTNQIFEYTKQKVFLTHNWTIVKTYKEFITCIINNGLPEFISFDHDLGEESMINGEEKSGYDCAKWLIDFCITKQVNLPANCCHSMNPVGSANIQGLLNNYAKFCLK